MARLAGLPTRIEIGFTPGTSDRTGTYTVTNKNAHAWPEVYFSGYGWVRFEPTASAPAGVAQPDYAPDPNKPAPGSIAQGEHSGPNTKLEQDLTDDQRAAAAAANIPNQKSPSATAEHRVVPLGSAARRRRGRPAADARGGAGGPAPPAAARRSRPGCRPTRRATGCGSPGSRWPTPRCDLHDLWPAARTPRRTADWVAGPGLPAEASTAGYRLARAVERSRYAPRRGRRARRHRPRRGRPAGLPRPWRRRRPRRERWRARFIPVSVLARLSERSADVLDWLDELGARPEPAARAWSPPGRHRRLTGVAARRAGAPAQDTTDPREGRPAGRCGSAGASGRVSDRRPRDGDASAPRGGPSSSPSAALGLPLRPRPRRRRGRPPRCRRAAGARRHAARRRTPSRA